MQENLFADLGQILPHLAKLQSKINVLNLLIKSIEGGEIFIIIHHPQANQYRITQNEVPYNLNQEIRILLDASIEEYTRQHDHLKTLLDETNFWPGRTTFFCSVRPFFIFPIRTFYRKKQTMNNNHTQPAFPPQVAQDSLGRIIAPIPGFSKLEYAALMLLPAFMEVAKTTDISIKGKKCNVYEATIESAKQLLDKVNETENEKNTDSLILQ